MKKAHLFNLAGLCAYLAGYIALLAWFKWVDVYNAHFDATGPIVLIYNVARTAFIFYLFCIVTATGSLALRLAVGMPADTDLIEQRVLGFFAGAGIWHIAMLGLGYLNLYTAPVVIALTLPFVALSWPGVALAIERWRWSAVFGAGVSFRVTLAASLVVFLGLMLLAIKGLYPGGGHDYFTHYFQYYETVIRNHGIWPNEVWYHYYYSKGAGLFFLGMLLTDPLAPQLVTYCFMAAAAAALYLIVRAGASDRAWPWAAAGLFLAVFINTPGWGEFEKQHEVNAAFVIAIAWMWARSLSTNGQVRAAYVTGTAFTVVGAVIQNSTVAVFFGASFGILALWFGITRKFRQAILCFALASVAGTALLATFAINYVTTGLADDQTILLFWRFANLEKQYEWGVLLPVFLLHWGKTGMAAAHVSLAEAFTYFVGSMRLSLFYPLYLSAAFVCTAAIYFRWRQGNWPSVVTARNELLALTAMIFVTVALTVTAGLVQPISFHRYSSFVVPVLIAAGILVWEQPAMAGPFIARIMHDWRASFVFAFALFFLILTANVRINIFSSMLVVDGRNFLFGRYSIDTAYLRQDRSWYPSGAITPGARGAYAVVGPRTPIWSMNIQAYCMLPGCQVETVSSFTLGSKYPDVMFGSPEAARAALVLTNHNYFLISNSLPLEDFLVRSPLFSPDTIAGHLGIRWTDGKNTLLTWLGPETQPLDSTWVANYRKKLETSNIQGFPYAEMQAIFTRLNATPHPWRSVDLPWVPKP